MRKAKKLTTPENLMISLQLLDMDMVSNIGLMEHTMKVIGIITKLKDKELFGMQKVISIGENSKMIWRMDMVNTFISMEASIKVNLKMTYKKDTEKKNG